MERRILGPRLEAVASFIPDGARVADVGTDHGLLPIWLRIHGRSPSVIASDIRPGPLEAAKRNAARYGVNGISFRLCSGLACLRQEEADVVVIAGMSGETIVSILDAAGWDWRKKRLIFQANTKQPELLIWLYAHDLHIEAEKIIQDHGRYYRVFCAAFGKAALPRPAYLWGGFSSGPFAVRQANLLKSAMSGLQFSSDPADRLRFEQYEIILEDMKNAYRWCDPELSGEVGPAGDQNGL